MNVGVVSPPFENREGWGSRGYTLNAKGWGSPPAKEGVGIASTANGASDTSAIGKLQTANGVVGLIPVAGTASSIAGMFLDVYRAHREMSQCH